MSGEGWGHTTRIAALSRELTHYHDLEFWCPDTVSKKLKTLLPNAKIHPLPSLLLVKETYKINNLKTALKNIPLICKIPKIASALAKDLIAQNIDAVISDYEPFLSRAGLKANLPVIAFNHQGILHRHPKLTLSCIKTLWVNHLVIPRGIPNIISSFYDGDVGPLLRAEVLNTTPTKGSHIIIYEKKPHSKIAEIAKKNHPAETFKVFPQKTENFINALASAKAIITTAGHQLLSESLHFQKPILAIPQKTQYEQELNAEMLEKSGWGQNTSQKTFREDLATFLKDLPNYPKPPSSKIIFKTQDDTQKAAKLINKILTKSTYESTVPLADPKSKQSTTE